MASVTVRGHFDGKKILLDEPFDLKPDDQLLIAVVSGIFIPSGVSGAYMNDEPKYSVDMVKEPNPDYGASKGETAITKETVKAEIDKVPEQHLEALLHFIKRFEGKRGALEGKDILESLRDIKIAGPKDFSQNIDLYLTGEKNIE